MAPTARILAIIKRPLAWALGIAVCLALAATVLLSLLLASAPWPQLASTQARQANQASAQSIHKLVDRQRIKAVLQGHPVELPLPTAELSAAVNDMAQRALGGHALIQTQAGQSQAWLSLPIERTPLRSLSPLGAWLNIQGQVQQNAQGLPQLQALQVGSVPVPPALALWLIQHAAQHQNLDEVLQAGLDTVQQLHLTPSQIQLKLHWSSALQARTMQALIPSTERARVAAYQTELSHLMASPPDEPQWQRYQPKPLIEVLVPLFKKAQQRSMGQMFSDTEADTGDIPNAALENRAVLLALTLHVMRNRITQINQGAPSQAASAPLIGQGWARPLGLHGREDFGMHFVVSALLASGMGGRLTDIIGTYKEIYDERDGSGFSFNDLAADRAGVRFGQRALHDPIALQQRVPQGQTDDFFMPEVSDLPEFLSPEAFQATYGRVGSPQYQAVMANIEQRVSRVGVLAAP
jgi:hypothetical protein